MKTMKKRACALVIALMMCLSVMPLAAFAAEETDVDLSEVEAAEILTPAEEEPEEAPAEEPEETPIEEPAGETEAAEPLEEALEEASDQAPYLTGLKIKANGQTYEPQPFGDCFYTAVPGTVILADTTLTLTTVPEVKFESVTTSNPALYVYSATADTVNLRFNMSVTINGIPVNLDSADATMSLTSTDGKTWSGEPGSIAQVTLSTLADTIMQSSGIQFPAGSMAAANDSALKSGGYQIIANQYGDMVYFVFCPEGTAVYTVQYVRNGTTVTWLMPEGMPLNLPQPVMQEGQTFSGWHTDEALENPLAADAAADADTTLYGKVTGDEETKDIDTAITNKDAVIYISTVSDWGIFAQRASEIGVNQLVVLKENLDLGGASYKAVELKGSFDGNGKTISNGVFSAKDNASGVFSKITANQVLANLNLDNIRVSTAENAGVLVGSAEHATIQNVQITNSQVNGRNAGGVVGYAFLTQVKYCSTKNTKVSGLGNGGGIVGISYATISNCFSADCTITSWRHKGGIAANCPEASHVSYCWGTYGFDFVGNRGTSDVTIDDDTCDANLTDVDDLYTKGYNTTYWDIGDDIATTGFTPEAAYDFPSA